jgi:hypothetical protein
MHSENRPTFFTETGQPIRAAGILCYVNHKYFNKDKTKDTSKDDKKIWLLRKQDESFYNTSLCILFGILFNHLYILC